ncbi:hypothetical protein TNIN_311371, partial [Trichonephila inaurata madagascariensis]
MPSTREYNLQPRRGAKVESRPSSEKRTQQGGPVRSRGSREKQQYRPYADEQGRVVDPDDCRKADIFFLGLNFPPYIIEELSSSDLIAREGTNVTLNCASKGYPEPKLSWYREHYKPGDAGNWQKDSLVQ